jgi:hypothetical protein
MTGGKCFRQHTPQANGHPQWIKAIEALRYVGHAGFRVTT